MPGIAILGGFGVVGSGVAKMIISNGERIALAAGAEVKLTHIIELRDETPPEGVILTKNFEDVLTDDDVKIVVETIGGVGAAYKCTLAALRSGRHVVTSNKELVTEHGDELLGIAREHNVMYAYEASVGGGIPVLRPISLCLSGNNITRIDGIVNGSSNYILSRMAGEKASFSAALGEARRLGYAEENPAADVEGWDARRKLAILAHQAFGSYLSDSILIPTEGISRITETDMAAAAAFGRAIKLIAHGELGDESWGGWVHPAAVSPTSPLYNVNQAFNAILVKGDFVDDVMFYGPGAGSYPTASAVVGDIIDVVQNIDRPKLPPVGGAVPAFLPLEGAKYRYLFAAGMRDEDFAAIAAMLGGAAMRKFPGGAAFMTGELTEGEMNALRDKIERTGIKTGALLKAID